MENKENNRIKVYYDGLCLACNREMDHYKSQVGAQNIEFIDICASGFDPQKEGLDPFLVHKEMHVRRTDGSVATRVDAFIVIWETLPKLNFLARLARRQRVRGFLDVGYTIFTKIRPWLPRKTKKEDCQDSPYCEVKNV
jgi:predicted DCC family thiol-disulfide oxidoreductase YuxK